jgi:hypothetical protein
MTRAGLTQCELSRSHLAPLRSNGRVRKAFLVCEVFALSASSKPAQASIYTGTAAVGRVDKFVGPSLDSRDSPGGLHDSFSADILDGREA